MKTPFDFLKNCFLKTETTTSDKGQFPQYYPVVHMMSFYPELLSKMVDISVLQSGIPDWAVGCLLYHTIKRKPYLPKGSKYISAKSTKDKENPELETIKKIYCVNDKHGLQLLKILKQDKLSFGEKGRKSRK